MFVFIGSLSARIRRSRKIGQQKMGARGKLSRQSCLRKKPCLQKKESSGCCLRSPPLSRQCMESSRVTCRDTWRLQRRRNLCSMPGLGPTCSFPLFLQISPSPRYNAPPAFLLLFFRNFFASSCETDKSLAVAGSFCLLVPYCLFSVCGGGFKSGLQNIPSPKNRTWMGKRGLISCAGGRRRKKFQSS